MHSYSAYIGLKTAFRATLGLSGKIAIPDELAHELAAFIDAYPTDQMVCYYSRQLLSQFYRKRSRTRSVRLFDTLYACLRRKSALIGLFFQHEDTGQAQARPEDYDSLKIWHAIDDLDAGYDKANQIGRFSHLFNEETIQLAYQAALDMPATFKARALAGIFCRMDNRHKVDIFCYLSQQLLAGSAEAAYQLKRIFPYLDKQSRSAAITLHLDTAGLPDEFTAYLAIRNAHYLEADDAVRLATRARTFQSDYLRIRCLLKLVNYLHPGEAEQLYRRFMDDFTSTAANVAQIHNLYHFAAALPTLDKDHVIRQALDKIASLDDSQNSYYEQQKYGALLFILPMLSLENREQALSIAATVRRGYRKTLMARINVHFFQNKGCCDYRGAPICY